MTAESGFLAFLLLTLVLLGAVVRTGLRARRRWHLGFVAATLASLATTIFYAKRMGTHYDIHAAGWITPVHLWMAKVTTLAYLAPLLTGLLTLRDARWRPKHRVLAFAVLALTVLTAVTGTWMLLASPHREPS